MHVIGRLLILFGVILIILGLFMLGAGKLPWLGKLPGDVMIKKTNFTFYFPLTTCIIVSIVLSLIISLIIKR